MPVIVTPLAGLCGSWGIVAHGSRRGLPSDDVTPLGRHWNVREAACGQAQPPILPNPQGFPDPQVRNVRYLRYDRRKFLKSQVLTNRN